MIITQEAWLSKNVWMSLILLGLTGSIFWCCLLDQTPIFFNQYHLLNTDLSFSLGYVPKFFLTQQLSGHSLWNHILIPLSYGPISTTSLEKVASGPMYLSHEHHSIESALAKVVNDLLHAADCGYVSVLVTVDISAAFDIFEHFNGRA